MASKVYRGSRDESGTAEVFVEEWIDGRLRIKKLRHVGSKSPTGFEWGYAGSGPADLANSILSDVLEVSGVSPRMYQKFKFDVVVDLKRDGFQLPAEQVQKWLQERWATMEHDAIQDDFVAG